MRSERRPENGISIETSALLRKLFKTYHCFLFTVPLIVQKRKNTDIIFVLKTVQKWLGLQPECHNYIRVLARYNKSDLLICGTHAYQPMCRLYNKDGDGEYRQESEFQGVGTVPYNPDHNSTYLLDGNYLYSGTGMNLSWGFQTGQVRFN